MCQKAFEGNDLFLAAEAARDSCADDCKRGKKKKNQSNGVFSAREISEESSFISC